jgi:hypothetical protein
MLAMRGARRLRSDERNGRMSRSARSATVAADGVVTCTGARTPRRRGRDASDALGEQVEREIAELEEQSSAMKAQWQQERELIDRPAQRLVD